MISIVIPAYNCKPYLERCINSVKAQTHKDWECIIVNDGSRDGTLSEARRLTKDDSRFRIISLKANTGASNARNLGVEESSGDSIFFLDADDYIIPESLEYLLNEARDNPTAGRIFAPCIVHSVFGERMWSVLPTGLHRPDSAFPFKDPSCDVGHCIGSLYVKDRIKGEILFPEVKIFEDMLMNMSLILAGTTTLITGRYLYHYFRRPDSTLSKGLTREEANANRKALVEIFDRWGADDDIRFRYHCFLENAMMSRIR